jgi:hypothetical protein
MGELVAARTWAASPESLRARSPRLARWVVRALLADPGSRWALDVLLRHLRLVSVDPERARAHGDGVLVARAAQLLGRLVRRSSSAPPSIRAELFDHLCRMEALAREPEALRAFEAHLVAVAARRWAGPAPGSPAPG